MPISGVFDPQGGVAPQLLSLIRESAERVRLSWQGEPGRRYGIQSRTNVGDGTWTRLSFSTGTSAILPTNDVVQATVSVPSTDTKRFLRVFEAD